MARRALAAWLLAAAALMAVSATATAARASEPSTSSLASETTSIEWTGEVPTGEAGPADCAIGPGTDDDPCDRFLITIEVEPSYWDTHTGALDVSIRWQRAEDDLDLYVVDEAGEQVASSVTPVGRRADLSIPDPVGLLEIHVVPVSVLEAERYEGEATLSSSPDPDPQPPAQSGGGGLTGGSGAGSHADASVSGRETGASGVASGSTNGGLSFRSPPYGSQSFDSTGGTSTDPAGTNGEAPVTPAPPPSAVPTIAPIPSPAPAPVDVPAARSAGASRPAHVSEVVWLVLALALAAFVLTIAAVSEPTSDAPDPPSRDRPLPSPPGAFRMTTFDRRFVLGWG
jgi:hypothetical protein